MGKTILLVESDLDLRETLVEILSNAGFDVLLAVNGPEALNALFTRRNLSLILLDLRVPMMDGLEFRRRQLLNPNLARVPLVLLSGAPGDRDDADSPDFISTLHKPFSQDALLQLVARYCGEASDS